MRYPPELIDSIDRAFKFHQIECHSFTYYGYHTETKTFRVRFGASGNGASELLDLTRREAWILSLGMAEARTHGIRLGAEREAAVGGIAR